MLQYRRFLTTLERHFKNISQGSFSVTLDTLASMMNAIRMVWVISRHYNTDERMVPLMELIAGEIAGKVRHILHLLHLFHVFMFCIFFICCICCICGICCM